MGNVGAKKQGEGNLSQKPTIKEKDLVNRCKSGKRLEMKNVHVPEATAQ